MISIANLRKRDGNLCWLCWTYVPENLDWSHALGPSRDHVIPIMYGGSGRGDNIKLAHKLCNNRRNNKYPFEPGSMEPPLEWRANKKAERRVRVFTKTRIHLRVGKWDFLITQRIDPAKRRQPSNENN